MMAQDDFDELESEELGETAHPKVFRARGPAVCAPEELLRHIREMEMNLHRSPEGAAAQLHELARLDLAQSKPEMTSHTSPGSPN